MSHDIGGRDGSQAHDSGAMGRAASAPKIGGTTLTQMLGGRAAGTPQSKAGARTLTEQLDGGDGASRQAAPIGDPGERAPRPHQDMLQRIFGPPNMSSSDATSGGAGIGPTSAARNGGLAAKRRPVPGKPLPASPVGAENGDALNGHPLEHPVASGVVQRKGHEASSRGSLTDESSGHDVPATAGIHQVADRGMSGTASTLPHLETIQRSFGPDHDLSGVRSYVGGPATHAAAEIGASAYAKGNQVAFAETPNLHTAAHEAAHVVQQQAGVQLKGGVGQVGDPYEQHADAVAARVVQGKSAADLLGGRGPVSDPPQRPAKAPCGECGGVPAGAGECPACKATQALGAMQAAAMPAATVAPKPNASSPPAAVQRASAAEPNASMPQANASEVPLFPNQTCTNEELRAAEAAMHAICDSGVSSCNPAKISKKKLAKLDCEEVAARLALNKACLKARMDFQTQCFNGVPDPRHVTPMEETQRGIVHCETLLADCLKRRQEQEQPKTVPTLERVVEVLTIMGLSLALAAAVVAALADPEPASKVALALGSAALAVILLEELGIQPEEGFEGA